VILKILYSAGERARVLEPVAYIGEPGESLEHIRLHEKADISAIDMKPSPEGMKSQRAEHGRAKVMASPSARRIARELGVDLAAITGTGPGGRICKKDVMETVAHVPCTSTAETSGRVIKPSLSRVTLCDSDDKTEIPFSKTRRSIADRLTLSMQTIPHFYLTTDVDMTPALAARKTYNRNTETRISVNDMIIKATAMALTEFPRLNAHVAADRLIVFKHINIGLAVSTDEGVLVPVIPDADKKDIGEISRLLRDIIQRAEKGVLKTQSTGTFTISNVSMYLVTGIFPIINPPECAILGVGGITKRVVPVGDTETSIRDTMTLTLACDHRAVDGEYASRFLKVLKKHLEHCTFQRQETE